MAKNSKRRATEDANEVVDLETQELMLKCSERLDYLLSESVVECDKGTAEPLSLRNSEVDSGLVLYSINNSNECNQIDAHNRRKPTIYRQKFEEEITTEDLVAIAVTSEWILNKKGVYTTGRERRSELITGASHSPSLKKLLASTRSNQKAMK